MSLLRHLRIWRKRIEKNWEFEKNMEKHFTSHHDYRTKIIHWECPHLMIDILWLVVKKNTSCFMWVEEEWRSRFQVISLVCTLKSSALCLVTFKSSACSRCRSCSGVVAPARMYHTKGVELMTRHDRPSSSQVSCYSSLHNFPPDIIRAVWWGIDAVFFLLFIAIPCFLSFFSLDINLFSIIALLTNFPTNWPSDWSPVREVATSQRGGEDLGHQGDGDHF